MGNCQSNMFELFFVLSDFRDATFVIMNLYANSGKMMYHMFDFNLIFTNITVAIDKHGLEGHKQFSIILRSNNTNETAKNADLMVK